MNSDASSCLFSSNWLADQPSFTRQRELCFPEGGTAGLIETLRHAHQRGAQTALLHPLDGTTSALAQEIANANIGINLVAYSNKDAPPPADIGTVRHDFHPDVILMLSNQADQLSEDLLALIDVKNCLVVAQRTQHYFAHRPLFLISIPKSGTHLLYELAEAFGYFRGIECPDNPAPQTWYCVEYSNSHTVARDFFVDTVRRSVFGNRHHPFMSNPAIFIYRNPLDILVSEANYYHRDNRTPFSAYFASKDFRGRLNALIHDDWLLGNIRSRIGGFAPWLCLPNVIPISFEELIGEKGGGSDDIQADSIWSMQLKLHIPGVPEEYGQRVFNKNSATFNDGKIGGFRNQIDKTTLKGFFSLDQDFMEEFGYVKRPATLLSRLRYRWLQMWSPKALTSSVSTHPLRTDEFRRRPLKCSGKPFANTPVTVEYNYLDLYNIVQYREKYIAVPHGITPMDLDAFIQSPPQGVFIRNHLDRVKCLIDKHYVSLAG